MHEHCHPEERRLHSREENIALLSYMIRQSKHHADELHHLAHSMDGDAASLVHDAIVDLSVSTEKLEEALQTLRGE